MKTLITGCHGSLGSEIFKLLDNPLPFQGDLRDPSSLENLDFNGLIHTAAVKRNSPIEDIMNVNVTGTINLLNHCQFVQPNFTKIISSSEVFNDTPYGLSKLAMETIARAYYFKIDCVRLPTIWGSKKSLSDHWLSQAQKKEALDLYVFNGKTKKKFFVSLEEAAQFCVNIDPTGSVHYPKCKVFDSRTLAEVIADHFCVDIKEKIAQGDHYEFMETGCCSEDFSAISHEETLQALRKVFPNIFSILPNF